MINDRALCRGKRIDTGDWVQGFYVICRSKHYILKLAFDDNYDFGFDDRYFEWIEVDPSTLGRYTGLKDKHGERIFEGDLLFMHNYSFDNVLIVAVDEFHATRFCVVRPCHIDNRNKYRLLLKFDGECGEIIGNVHDGEFAKGARAE